MRNSIENNLNIKNITGFFSYNLETGKFHR